MSKCNDPRPCVLFLFNSSLYAMEPWLQAGHTCVTVDYHDTDHSAHRDAPEPVEGVIRMSLDLSTEGAMMALQRDLGALGLQPALCISFAPCTDLAVSGAAHFEKKRARDPMFQGKAARMATQAQDLGCPYVVENPVSVLSTLWCKPDVICHPKDFGGHLPAGDVHPEAPSLFPPRDAYNKKTCLWLGYGAQAPEKNPVPEAESAFPGHRALGGKSAKTKHLRSLTPRGLAIGLYKANRHLLEYGFCLTRGAE